MGAEMALDDSVNILLVDDQPGKLLAYEAILDGLNANLIKATTAEEALASLLKTEIAVILMDVCMPDLDGFELASMIRNHPRHEKTAIIFISAVRLETDDLLKGYEPAPSTMCPVPVVPEILKAKVQIFVELYRKSRQLDSSQCRARTACEATHRAARRVPFLAATERRTLAARERSGAACHLRVRPN